jgi:hypothetical protein
MLQQGDALERGGAVDVTEHQWVTEHQGVHQRAPYLFKGCESMKRAKSASEAAQAACRHASGHHWRLWCRGSTTQHDRSRGKPAALVRQLEDAVFSGCKQSG